MSEATMGRTKLIPSAGSAAVYMWDRSGLNVLIPKRKGKGYLRTPYGHHALPKIEAARWKLDDVDFCGLDGYLGLEYGMILDRVEQKKITAKALPVLAEAYGFTAWVEDQELFWNILQNNQVKDASRARLT